MKIFHYFCTRLIFCIVCFYSFIYLFIIFFGRTGSLEPILGLMNHGTILHDIHRNKYGYWYNTVIGGQRYRVGILTPPPQGGENQGGGWRRGGREGWGECGGGGE